MLKEIQKLNKIGIALSSEKDINKILELIVDESMSITNADGGTLYRMIDNNTRLKFEISKNKSLGWNHVGMSEEIFYPVKLYDSDSGEPNNHNVSAYCALSGETVNIKDAYNEEGFDFSGLKGFDEKQSYRSTSMLNVPLKDHEDNIIGVLQLLNSTCNKTNEIIPFENEKIQLIESLSSQAAVALNNRMLLNNLEKLFDSLVRYTVKAIDSRSHHTAGHSSRVAKLTRKFAEVVSSQTSGVFKEVFFNDDELYEIWISGLVHDVGKIGTPEAILDKHKKLDGAKFDLILERLKRYKSILKCKYKDEELHKYLIDLDDDYSFLIKINEPGYMSEEDLDKLNQIYNKSFYDGFDEINYLTDEEYDNLSIRRGNLTSKEREIIQGHIIETQKLLKSLDFPEKLKNVPFYAGAHHENINGKGYPDNLKGNEIPLPARMMAIVDIWEAVTAQDRPYRPPVNDTIASKIIKEEVDSGKLDKDLVELFIKEQVWSNKK